MSYPRDCLLIPVALSQDRLTFVDAGVVVEADDAVEHDARTAAVGVELGTELASGVGNDALVFPRHGTGGLPRRLLLCGQDRNRQRSQSEVTVGGQVARQGLVL